MLFRSAGIFAGSLLGGFLGPMFSADAEVLGVRIVWPSNLCWLFLLSAFARCLVALIFIPYLKEVRTVPPRTAGWLIFRVTQFHAVAGLIFSIFPFAQRPERGRAPDK